MDGDVSEILTSSECYPELLNEIIIIKVYFRPTTENSEGPYSKYNRIKYRYKIQTQVSVTRTLNIIDK